MKIAVTDPASDNSTPSHCRHVALSSASCWRYTGQGCGGIRQKMQNSSEPALLAGQAGQITMKTSSCTLRDVSKDEAKAWYESLEMCQRGEYNAMVAALKDWHSRRFKTEYRAMNAMRKLEGVFNGTIPSWNSSRCANSDSTCGRR